MVEKDEFAPAVLLEQEDGTYDLSLVDFEAGYEIANARGLRGGAHTWEALVKYLVGSRAPEHASAIEYDSEGDTLVAMSGSLDAIRAVGALVQEAIADPNLLREAFDKADDLE